MYGDLSAEERYNILEGHGYKEMAREIIDNEECNCVLPEQSCAICNLANKIIGYPPMPNYLCSPDYFEMWELD